MNRPEIQRAAEEELAKRFQQQLYGLPPQHPGNNQHRVGTPDAAAGFSRPGTASVTTQPTTRPSSRTPSSFAGPGEFLGGIGLAETAMATKRASSASASYRTSTPDGRLPSGMSTRPASAAFTLLEMHKADVSASAAGGRSAAGGDDGRFFERGRFRELYRQLQQSNRKDFVQSSWDGAALAAMEKLLFSPAPAAAESTSAALSDVPATRDALRRVSEPLTDRLRHMHSLLDQTATREVGGDGADVLHDAESRFQYFRQQLMNDELRSYPALSHLVGMVFSEHDRMVAAIKRRENTSEQSILRDTLRGTVQQLAEAKEKQLLAEKGAAELREVVRRLTDANLKAQQNQEQLENYVDELRVTLSTFTIGSLRGAPQMRPDTSSKAGFVEAIRRMAREVETLREENMKLSEVASNYVENQSAHAAEMQVMLGKANQYQQQVGQLKAAIRAMKGYVDQLEARLRELRNVHEENELLRSSVPMQVAKFEREVVLPHELNLTLSQHQFLQQRGATLVCQAEYADMGSIPTDEKLVQLVTNRMPQRITVQPHNLEDLYEENDEDCVDSDDLSAGGSGGGGGGGSAAGGGGGSEHGGQSQSGTTKTPSSGRSLAPSSVAPSEFMQPTSTLPAHLSSRFGNVKLKQMSVHDVKSLILELFTDYGNAVEKKMAKDPRHVPVPFENFTKDWGHRRLKGERLSFEQNMSLFYWADVYRYRAPEMVMYHKASVGHVSGFIHEVVTNSLLELKARLTQCESSNKKQKDRISRVEFLTCLKQHLPHLTPVQLEALTASSLHAQDGRYTEEVVYEPFFDRTNPSGVFMYDALVRAVIAHAEFLYLSVEERCYSLLHERNSATFDRMHRMRDESGSSGSQAVQQMRVESAVAEKVGQCPLRIIAQAITAVDPFCTPKKLWLSLAIAAGLPELNRLTSTEAQEEALEQMHDMTAMMRNLRRGVTFTISPQPPPQAPAPAGDTKEASTRDPSGKRASLVSPTGQQPLPLDASAKVERSQRPPSATIV